MKNLVISEEKARENTAKYLWDKKGFTYEEISRILNISQRDVYFLISK